VASGHHSFTRLLNADWLIQISPYAREEIRHMSDSVLAINHRLLFLDALRRSSRFSGGQDALAAPAASVDVGIFITLTSQFNSFGSFERKVLFSGSLSSED